MSTVNIIMATYNGDKYLREQIDSILNSNYTDWNLLICDDGSTDDTVDIVTEYVLRYSDRIFLYRNPKNMGPALNFLQGLKMMNQQSGAKGSNTSECWIRNSSNRTGYFMFCDQDDVWQRDKIERTLDCMRALEKKYSKEQPILVCTDAAVVNESLQPIHPSFYQFNKLNKNNSDLSHLLMENKCIGCTMMINSKLASFVQTLPSSARFHDWWLALIAVSFGHIAYLQKPTMQYRQHENNVVGTSSFQKYAISRMSNGKKLKRNLMDTQKQAEEFLVMYESRLDEKQKQLIKSFSTLYKKNWLKRRCIVLRYSFLKTGVIRNIGILLTL